MSEKEIHKCGDSISKAYEGCGCPTCKELNVNCDNCPVCQEEASKSYYSDEEDVDKWDNIEKACWVGYVQRGMKDKNGRKVPNCVPVSKSESEPTTKSFWNGSFDPRKLSK
jgi:hypothetical protein